MNCEIIEDLLIKTCDKSAISIMETEKKDFSVIKEMQINNCMQAINIYMKYCRNYNNESSNKNKYKKVVI